MFYLITQFVVVFLVAALLGGTIGWLMRARTLAKDLEAKWKSAYDREREAAEQCEKDKDACSERCQTLEAQVQTLEARIQTLQTQAEAAEPPVDDPIGKFAQVPACGCVRDSRYEYLHNPALGWSARPFASSDTFASLANLRMW